MIEQVMAYYEVGAIRTVEMLKAGNTAKAWKVLTTDGSWVVRTLKDKVQGEVEYQLTSHIHQQVDIVPQIIQTRSHQPVVQVGECWFNLQRQHDSTPFPVGESRSIADVGRVVGKLHRVLSTCTCSLQVPDRFELAKLWRSAKPLVEQVLDEAESHAEAFLLTLRDMEKAVEEALSTQNNREPVNTRIHGDLGVWNLLYRSDDVKIIDFGEARRGDFLFDVAAAMTSAIGYGFEEETSRELMEHFLCAYESEMGHVDRVRLREQVNLWFLRGACAALVFSTDPLAMRWKTCIHFLRARDFYHTMLAKTP